MRQEGLKKVYEENRIKDLEEKFKHVVSYVLKNGGVLEDGHVRFHEETFETTNQDKEVPNMRKRKWREVQEASNSRQGLKLEAYKQCQQWKNVHPYGNEEGYYDKRVNGSLYFKFSLYSNVFKF